MGVATSVGNACPGVCGPLAWLWAAGELDDEPPGDLRGEQRVTGGDDLDCRQQIGAGVFGEESAGSRTQRGVDVVVEVEGGTGGAGDVPSALLA
jgi:hypothetical protein